MVRKKPKQTKQVDEDILSDLEWVEFYRQNPVIAAEDILIRNGRPLSLPPHQRIILKDLWNGTPFPMIIMTRGGGKTTTIAIYYILRALLYPEERLGILSGGYRAAKATFDEILKFYEFSPIFRRCVKGKPVRGNDECRLIIDKTGSIIKALPIGDGSIVRGQRFFRLFIDEFPQVDKGIMDEVIIPMLATRKDPTAPLEAEDSKNQLILASTATWQFNWAYQMYLEYKKQVEAGNKLYSLHEFDCDDLGDFMDKTVIEFQKAHSPRIVFLMEYKLLWPKDSHGWYPASLIEQCRKSYCLIETKGKKDEEYVLGVDPARESDLFAVSVLRLGANSNRLVKVETLEKPTFPEMAQKVRQLTREFNVVRIAMDYGGGGLSVRDQLAEESVVYDPKTGEYIEETPILPIDPKEFPERQGRRILDVVYFSPKEIHQMNIDLKSDMEHNRLIIPRQANDRDEESEEVYAEIVQLEEELRNIVATVKPSGVLHFDTPNKNQIKDRYTSLMLAVKAAKDYQAEQDQKVKPTELAWGFWT